MEISVKGVGEGATVKTYMGPTGKDKTKRLTGKGRNKENLFVPEYSHKAFLFPRSI